MKKGKKQAESGKNGRVKKPASAQKELKKAQNGIGAWQKMGEAARGKSETSSQK